LSVTKDTNSECKTESTVTTYKVQPYKNKNMQSIIMLQNIVQTQSISF